MLTVGSLFAGIGGIELGLERTGGFRTVWQVENDPYAQKVLAKHWPDVRRWDDVRTFPPSDGDWSCDLICGGFPCQDISYAGRGAGLDGERSGLFYEAARIIREVGPGCVLLENVSALLTRGIDAVLGTLASLGYDAEWHCIPAAAVGAPHIRDRVFIIGYLSDSEKRGQPELRRAQRKGGLADCGGQDVANPPVTRLEIRQHQKRLREFAATVGSSQWWTTLARFCRMAYGISETSHRSGVSHEQADCEKTSTASNCDEREEVPAMREGSQAIESAPSRLQSATKSGDPLSVMPCQSGSRGGITENQTAEEMCGVRGAVHAQPQQESYDLLGKVLESIGKTERREAMEGAFTDEELRMVWKAIYAAKSKGEDVLSFLWEQAGLGSPWALGEWPGQPRVETGVANRVDRLRCLGNAVVPQVAEYIGQQILLSHTKGEVT